MSRPLGSGSDFPAKAMLTTLTSLPSTLVVEILSSKSPLLIAWRKRAFASVSSFNPVVSLISLMTLVLPRESVSKKLYSACRLFSAWSYCFCVNRVAFVPSGKICNVSDLGTFGETKASYAEYSCTGLIISRLSVPVDLVKKSLNPCVPVSMFLSKAAFNTWSTVVSTMPS